MKKIVIILCACILVSQSCTVNYTLSGASIAPEVETVSVQHFVNRAPLGVANMEQYITNELKDKFKSQTRLTTVNDAGDLNFEGEIVDFNTKPMAITQNEKAAQNRLTIAVRVKFTNEVEPKYNFDQTFSQYEDYDSDQDLASVEQELMEKIVEKLIEDIFNKSVVNW